MDKPYEVRPQGVSYFAEIDYKEACLPADWGFLQRIFCQALEEDGFNILSMSNRSLSPNGFLVAAVLGESHASLSVRKAGNSLQFVLSSCRSVVDGPKTGEYLANLFGCSVIHTSHSVIRDIQKPKKFILGNTETREVCLDLCSEKFLIGDMYGIDRKNFLDNHAYLKSLLLRAVRGEERNPPIVEYEFPGQGYTLILALDSFVVALHTYPEMNSREGTGTLQLDLYGNGGVHIHEEVFQKVKRALRPECVRVTRLAQRKTADDNPPKRA